ncbi:MAG: alpha/beta hydrolase [Myxococcota bacterium]
MNRPVRIALLSLCAGLIAVNAIAAAHAWRFTHFASTGDRTASPEALSTSGRLRVALTGVVVPRPELGRTPADAGLTAASRRVAGVSTWVVGGSNRGTVLMFHGYGGTKSDLLDEASIFHELGWTAVLADFPGSGESPGDTTSLGWGEAEVVADLVTAYADDGPVILYGQSMGSAAALRAVGGLGAEATALILENPYDRLLTTVGHRFEAMGLPAQPGAALLVFWGGLLLGFDGFDMDPVDFATGIRAPTLFLTGEADPRVRPAEVAAIRAQLGGPAELELFPNAGHVGLLSADPERWRAAVASFLHRNGLDTPSDSNPRTPLSTP